MSKISELSLTKIVNGIKNAVKKLNGIKTGMIKPKKSIGCEQYY